MNFPDGDPVKILGMRVVEASTLPEGILMFVKDDKVVGIIDNRADQVVNPVGAGMTILTDDLIEKAARAKWGDPHEFPWDQMSEPCKNIWRAEARRALTAVLPDVLEAVSSWNRDFAEKELRAAHIDGLKEADAIATRYREGWMRRDGNLSAISQSAAEIIMEAIRARISDLEKANG